MVLPLLTKYLTPVDYAVAGVVASYTGMFSVLQTLGLPIIIGTSYYKNPTRYPYIWRQLLGFLTIQSVFYCVFIGIIYYLVIPEEAADDRIEIILLNTIPMILFAPTQIFVFRYYQKSGRPVVLMLRTLWVGLISIGLNVYFIAFLHMGYMGWFWSTALSGLAGFLAFFYPFFIRKKFTPIFNFKWRTIKSSLKVSLPTIPHYYSGYLLNSSDRAVMDMLKVSTDRIGLYSFAYNFGNYFEAAATAMTNASSPMYMDAYRYKSHKEAEIFSRNLTWLKQGIFLLATSLFCLWSKEIFQLLVSNPELAKVYPLSIIIVMAYNYRPMYIGVMARLVYHEKTKSFWRVSFVAGVVNVALNLTLIPVFGYQTAAYTTFAAFMYMGYSGYFLSSFKQLSQINFKPMMWLSATIIATVGVYFLVELDVWIKVALTIAMLALLGYLGLKWKSRRSKVKRAPKKATETETETSSEKELDT